MTANRTISNGLDYTIDSLDERKNKVTQIINQHDSELVTYFDDYYNPSLTQGSRLSDNDLMCRQLERMADYLLYSDNKEKRNDNHDELHIVGENDDKQNKKKEYLTDQLTSLEEGGKTVQQHKLYRKVKVTKEDREHFAELKDTGELIDRLNTMIKSGVDSNGNKIEADAMKKLKWFRIEIRKDEVAIKEMLKGYIRFKRLSPESTELDYSHFSFTNQEHVKALLDNYSELKQNSFDDTQGDLKMILNTFENLIDDTQFEKYVYDIFLMKIDGLSRKKIGYNIKERHNLDFSESRISQITNNIIPQLIVETYKKSFEDWVYIFLKKGIYKVCNKCGENKLTKHFGKYNHSKDGLRSTCRNCR